MQLDAQLQRRAMFLSACRCFEAASVVRDSEGTGLTSLIDRARTPGSCLLKCDICGCLFNFKGALNEFSTVPVFPLHRYWDCVFAIFKILTVPLHRLILLFAES